MKYTLDISEDSKHGEASRAAMQTYAYHIESEDREKFEFILNLIHQERRRILHDFSKRIKNKE